MAPDQDRQFHLVHPHRPASYPEELNRLIEKKARPAPGQVYTFNLGSFDVKGPEHGQAIHAFLDAWMRSTEPAESFYKAMVGSRFEE